MVVQVEWEGDCLDKMAPGGTCQIGSQCQGGSNCVNGKCACPPGSSDQFGTCQQSGEGDDTALRRGSVKASAIAVRSAPQEKCGNGEACTGGSFCQVSVCTCPAGTVVSNRQCITPSTGQNSLLPRPLTLPCKAQFDPRDTITSVCLTNIVCPTNPEPLSPARVSVRSERAVRWEQRVRGGNLQVPAGPGADRESVPVSTRGPAGIAVRPARTLLRWLHLHQRRLSVPLRNDGHRRDVSSAHASPARLHLQLCPALHRTVRLRRRRLLLPQ